MSSSVSAPGPIPLLIAQLESSSSHSLSSAHRPLPANSRRVAHVSRGGLAPPPSSSVEVLYGRHLSAVGDPHVVVPANGDSQLPSLAEGSLRASPRTGHLVHRALLLCHFLPRCLLRSCRSTPFRDMSLPCTSYALPQGELLIVRVKRELRHRRAHHDDEKGVSIPLPQARLSRKVSTVWSRFGDVDFAGEWSVTISSSNYQHLATEIFKERNDALSEIWQ